MTRKDIKIHWEQILAFKNDKAIQVKSLSTGIWHDTNDPSFGIMYEFRVKPEPKLVPFTYLDAKDLIGKAVIGKIDKSVRLIGVVTENDIMLSNSSYLISFRNLLDYYLFLDGSPIGITITNE